MVSCVHQRGVRFFRSGNSVFIQSADREIELRFGREQTDKDFYAFIDAFFLKEAACVPRR